MPALQGMKQIVDHMKRSEATVLKLIREEGFPAVKIAGSWESTTEQIEKWRELKVSGASLEEIERKSKAKGRGRK